MRTSDRRWLWAGVAGVTLYVATWFVAGLVSPEYDPLRQAISELFDLGAPPWRRVLVTVVLVLTGIALVPFGPVLGRVLPGEGRLGPALVVVAGVGTVLAGAFPCTAGCPGASTSTTDLLHTVTAGGGYVGLVTAPLAFAWRLRGTGWDRLARAGLLLGGLATLGFVVRNVGVDVLPGLQQRVFNTLADGWYVLAALTALRRGQATGTAASDSGSGSTSGATTGVGDSTPVRHSSNADNVP